MALHVNKEPCKVKTLDPTTSQISVFDFCVSYCSFWISQIQINMTKSKLTKQIPVMLAQVLL